MIKMKGRILVINTGSTSSKIGFYDSDEKLFEQICSALQCRIDQNNLTTKIYQIVNILQEYLNRIM